MKNTRRIKTFPPYCIDFHSNDKIFWYLVLGLKGSTTLTRALQVGHNIPTASKRKCKHQLKNSRRIFKFQSFCWTLGDCVQCTNFQVDSCYGLEVMVPKWFLTFLTVSDPIIQDGFSKIERHQTIAWACVCTKFQVDSSKTFWIILMQSLWRHIMSLLSHF